MQALQANSSSRGRCLQQSRSKTPPRTRSVTPPRSPRIREVDSSNSCQDRQRWTSVYALAMVSLSSVNVQLRLLRHSRSGGQAHSHSCRMSGSTCTGSKLLLVLVSEFVLATVAIRVAGFSPRREAAVAAFCDTCFLMPLWPLSTGSGNASS
jgi:hypothetical protein